MNATTTAGVTAQDWIECGLRLGLTAPRTLELARAEGIRCRTADFYAAWKQTRQQLVRTATAANGAAA